MSPRPAKPDDGFDECRHFRLRIEPRDELLNLPLAAKARKVEDFSAPLAIQMRREEQQPGQVELATRDPLVDLGISAHEPRSFRAAVGLIFTHAQLVHPVRVERGAGALTMNSARLHLSQMRE